MELYNEEDLNASKKSKLPLIIVISIVVLIIISVGILYGIIYIKSTITKITLDGVSTSALEKIFLIEETENGSKLYIPIRKIAQYFEYQDYNGDYKYKSEDTSKCYVKNENETAMFTLDSSILVKSRGNSDYEYIDLDQKVFEKDGELYTTIDGIKKAFNVEFIYDEENRRIDIYTMDYLVTYYTNRLNIQDYSDDFSDKKAIFEDMIIVQQNNQYGVVNAATGVAILEMKYDSVKYLPNTGDFLVGSNGKYGIISKNTKIKLNIGYDSIKIMDNQNGLYLIQDNNLYGVADLNGNIVIEPRYQQIGVGNIEQYAQNGIESQYVMVGELIPIKNNNLWGFFNLQGEQVTDFIYTNVGCTSSKVTNSYSVLEIPSYKLTVVKQNNYYNLITINGKEILPANVVDSIYMLTNAATGENTYYMTYNGQTSNIEEQLLKQGI